MTDISASPLGSDPARQRPRNRRAVLCARNEKARADVGSSPAERQRGGQAAAVGHAACGEHGNGPDRIGDLRYERHRADSGRAMPCPPEPSANDTAAGPAVSVAANASSSSDGTTWLTTNGRSVSSRTRAACASSASDVVKIAPASPTVAMSSADVARQIATCRTGISIAKSSVNGVRRLIAVSLRRLS